MSHSRRRLVLFAPVIALGIFYILIHRLGSRACLLFVDLKNLRSSRDIASQCQACCRCAQNEEEHADRQRYACSEKGGGVNMVASEFGSYFMCAIDINILTYTYIYIYVYTHTYVYTYVYVYTYILVVSLFRKTWDMVTSKT